MKRDHIWSLLLSLTITCNVLGASLVDPETTAPPIECTEEGKFPMCDECQEYYVCKYTNGSDEVMMMIPEMLSCQNEMFFSHSEQTCIPSSSLARKQQIADVIAVSNEVCTLIKSIDSYEKTTLSTVSLRESFDYKEKFNAYVTGYNKVLEEAKSDMRIWRNGNSIVEDIREMFSKAKQYEIEFDRMFDIAKERMKDAADSHGERLNDLKQEKKTINDSIKDKQSQLEGKDPEVKAYIRSTISHERENLRDVSKKIKESTPEALELEEMVSFLNLLKKHPNEVVERAANTTKRIQELLTKITIVNSSFYGYALNATRDQKTLKEQLINQEREKKRVQDEISRLENEEEQLRDNLDNLMTKQLGILENITKLNTMILDEQLNFDEKKKAVCQSNLFMKLFGTCSNMLEHFEVKRPDKSLVTKKNEYMQQNEQTEREIERISSLRPEIRTNISKLEEEKPSTETKIDKTSFELQEFELFLPEVSKLANGSSSVQQYLLEIAEKIEMTGNVFSLLVEDIENMINKANEAEGDNGKKETKKNNLDALESHQLIIDQISQIPNVRECSKL